MTRGPINGTLTILVKDSSQPELEKRPTPAPLASQLIGNSQA